MIKNISTHGICVVTPYMLKKDTIYSVKIHSKHAEAFLLSAVVVWSSSLRNDMESTEESYETGLMFIELSEERKGALDSFISTLPS